MSVCTCYRNIYRRFLNVTLNQHKRIKEINNTEGFRKRIVLELRGARAIHGSNGNSICLTSTMGSDVNAKYVSQEKDIAKIIVALCSQFYGSGWMPGTAGAMSILDGDLLYVTPSGVQKELMSPDDITIFNLKKDEFEPASSKLYKPSASAPVFRAITELTGTTACIHTHSKNAVLVTALILPGVAEYTISEVENIKAIPRYTAPGNLGFYDTLTIPIIENKPHEEELVDDLVRALQRYPGAPAILVRRHGLYVWGNDVWRAKIVNEAIEYLLDLSVSMHALGLKY